tara:strand:- start:7235 stop:8230 length:996 start_codon:yes stop_codon:yes gene_type:complete
MAFIQDPAKFKGVTSIQKDNISNNLLLGVQDFLSWSFLQVGAFQNISRSPAVSGSFSDSSSRYRLRMSDDPNYEQGQVWEGFRNDWVWESGFTYNDTKPIHVSGVWVDGYFYGSGDATYSHYVDYPNGRILFDYPVPIRRRVEANFSHRTVGITLASEKFVQELMYDSYDIEDLDSYLISSSGSRNQLGKRRLQLPVVALELSKGGKNQGWAIGGGQIVYNDILFHIFSDNEFEKNNLRDILLNQNEKIIYLINRAMMKENKKYPLQLNRLGYPVKNAKMYPDLISPTGEGGFRYNQARIDKMECTDMPPVNSWLHRSTVRATFSLISSDI